jgi:hypothetical protein
MKIHPMGAELLHADSRTDGRADMTKLIVAFLNFANVSKNEIIAAVSTEVKYRIWHLGT